MIQKDVLIVGGGPAGSACAQRLIRHGLDVLILDKADFPRQKPCAGWVTPALFRLLEISPGDYPSGLTHFTSFVISLKASISNCALTNTPSAGWNLTTGC